ncbi:transcription factor nrm1 whi5 [Diplodia corticola]|uniref:Transcription factor nrm1 whi5 n=1 Tax=Diplodia corticola TaxID=236234 RepID=A0A1J9RXF7_9PEZI|nr:transcription factor nrm1 whi5 [Diplodia corticola]OJD32165.1 transcription factor nrm1 whi5 [Diplodia corticola]
MPPAPTKPQTIGSRAPFDPDEFLSSWSLELLPQDDDLRGSLTKAFNLPAKDSYVYRATAEVTLDQVQHAIGFGGQHGLHGWYVDDENKPIPPPPSTDIAAYTNIFSPSTSTASALRGLASNAKKDSLRAAIAAHLQSQFHLASPTADTATTTTTTTPLTLTLPNKRKQPLANPYYDYWAWSCRALEWAGPWPGTAQTRISHHVLPVFYHHFGCAVPTWDALSAVAQLTQHAPPAPRPKRWPGREVVEIGSGNGYWALQLRRAAGCRVAAVDNAHSEWRTMWIGDTVWMDGVEFLEGRGGAREDVLLLVYPQVGADFTGRVLRAYRGDYVVVAGTQNRNGFTGFKDETIAEWMARERKEFERVAQVPLPSFAGKDEALFVFVRRR